MSSNVSRIISLIGPWPDEPGHPDYRRNKRLHALVRHAVTRCSYYRELFLRHSLSPSDIRTADDLKKIPLLSRQTVRTCFRELLPDGVNPDTCRIERTNGTTGKPTAIYNSNFEVWFQHALWVSGYMRFGVRPWHRQAKFMMGRSIPSHPKWFQRLGLFRRAYMGVSESPAAKISWLRDYRPDVLFTWGSVLNEMALCLEKSGEKLDIPLIITSSDTVLRDHVSSHIGGRLLDVYGATETGPLAWPCLDHDGYHLDPRWVMVEILDEQGEPADRGQLVCTVLWRRTMPLIRYQLDDIGEWETSTCGCGCRWPKIKKLIGRQSDLFTLPSGEQVTTGFVAEILRPVRGIAQFQLVQKSPVENLMFIVPTEEFSPDGLSAIQHAFAKKFGIPNALSIKLVTILHRPPDEKFRSIYTLMGVERMRRKGIDVEPLFNQ